MARREDKTRTAGFTAEKVWTEEGIPVLNAKVQLPPPPEGASPRAARRICRYYESQGHAYLRRCQRFLLPEAKAAYHLALAESRPLPCFQAELTGELCLQTPELWSLYTEARESCGKGCPLRLRWGDCWDLRTGWLLPLSAFFPAKSRWRKTILQAVEASIEHQIDHGLALYHPDWRHRLRRSFDAKSFCLTQQGLSVFWPMYALAPAMEGIPTFTLPYGPQGPFSPSEARRDTKGPSPQSRPPEPSRSP